jgi:putative membrane protein
MLSAFATSTIFLVCYLTYHYFHGTTHFRGQGAVRSFYFVLLGSHTVLAVLIVPLALTTLYRAWRQRFQQHKQIARWTLPLWLYVSVTGVLVYWLPRARYNGRWQRCFLTTRTLRGIFHD